MEECREIFAETLRDPHLSGKPILVFANKQDRMEECREIFAETLRDPHLSGKPILVFANKQDLPDAKGAAEVAQAMGLATLQNNRYNIVPATALRKSASDPPDQNVAVGIKWMTEHVDSEWGTLDPRVQRETEVQARKEEELRKERVKKGELARKERLEREAKEAEEKAKKEAGGGESGEIESITAPAGPGPTSESIAASAAAGDDAAPVPSTPVKDISPEKMEEEGNPTVEVNADRTLPSPNSLGPPQTFSDRGPLSPMPPTSKSEALKPLDPPNALSGSSGPSPSSGLGPIKKLTPLEPLGAPKNPLFDPRHEAVGARV